MSTTRAARLALLLALEGGCGAEEPKVPSLPEPGPARPRVEPPARTGRPRSAPPPDDTALPTRLGEPPPPSEGSRYDVDAGSFVAPSAAFALSHMEDGETEASALPRAMLGCLRGPGSVLVRLQVVPRRGAAPLSRVLESEGPRTSVDCVLEHVRKAPFWGKDTDPLTVELVLIAR